MNGFCKPPHRRNPQGEERRAGFEFELAGPELQSCARIVAELFGGRLEPKHSLEITIAGTSAGAFRVELDALIVKRLAEELEAGPQAEKEEMLDIPHLKKEFSRWMGETAGQIVPFEIVTPPLPFEQLPRLETLRERLREDKAEGTGAAFYYAFGMHINPEIASSDVNYLRDVLRAFLLLYPWLKEAMRVDFSRRLLTYIDPFPKRYAQRILVEDYAPSRRRFIADYLEENPTRNRALDMLPLFAHLEPDMLGELPEDERKLVKPRPAFHYRLPNCEIDDPNWRIARDWNYWVRVEELAEDKQKLAAMSREYLAFLEQPLHAFRDDWTQRINRKYGYAAAE